MSASARDRRHARAEERHVEMQAQVDQLIRLDGAEDQLRDAAERDVVRANELIEHARTQLAAAKRIDAMGDQVLVELRAETHESAGDVTSLVGELIDVTRERAAAPRISEVAK